MSGATNLSDEGARDGSRRPRGHLWWYLGFHATVLVGLLCAVERWGWQLSVAAALSAGFTAIIVWLPFVEGELPATRQFLGRAMFAGLSATAAFGLVALGGVAGVVVVLMLAGTSPHLRRVVRSDRWRSWLDVSFETPVVTSTGGLDTDSDLVAVTTEPLPDPVDLDDSELCLAWRQSFVRLEGCTSGPTHLDVVRRREEYLDELQRRNPDGFAAWLASGARAAGNPLPFLGTPTSALPPGDDPPRAEPERG